MKTYLLGAAAVLAVGAPSAYANDTSGHVDFSYQTANIDWSGGGSDDVDTWDFGGAVLVPMNGWGLQFNAHHENYNWNSSDYDDAATSATAHVISRNDSYAFGGYAGFGSAYGQTIYMVGLEGQLYMPNVTVDGALQWGDMSDGYDYTAWDARVSGSYFVNDNFAVNGGISYTSFDDYDDNATDFNIGATYRFTGSGFSVNGSYTNESWDYGSSDADADIFRVGFSYDFGTDSLKERSQQGASFDNERPFIGVWTRWD